MHENNIKQQTVKQLKKNFPRWKHLTKKEKKERCLFDMNMKRSQMYIKDDELKTIDALLNDTVLNILLSDDAYTPSIAHKSSLPFFPQVFFRESRRVLKETSRMEAKDRKEGYHIEHNYGHGKEHLSMNFFLLNLLVFFMHQIFELTDNLYRQARKTPGSKRNLRDHLRVTLHHILFPSWERLY